MKTLKINVHSFIDVITNSSTEIYVSVGTNTVNFIKNIIDTTLKMAKSDLRSDDLFIFDIESDGENWYGYEESSLIVTTKENVPAEAKEIAKNITENLLNIFDMEACYNG